VPNGGLYLEDARLLLQRPEMKNRFDFVIHDVFTGGSVPPKLFTWECWEGIKRTLRPEGIVAVNFAGDLRSQAAVSVFGTLLSSFPFCRAFEDNPSKKAGDYKNIVIVCSLKNRITFRDPVEADFLSSETRKKVLSSFQSEELDLTELTWEDSLILNDSTAAKLNKWQHRSALEHWHIMRAILPHDFWREY